MTFGTNKQEFKLIKIATIICGMSIAAFVFFLFQANQVQSVRKTQVGYEAVDLHSVINRERIQRDISPLLVNDKLMAAAQEKAEDMQKNNYFSHISPVNGKAWSEFIKDNDYTYKEAGENLANGYDSVEEMVEAWLNSPSHRENLLNESVSETGFGIVSGDLNNYPTTFVVQVFGEQQAEEANVIQLR